jgi:uncharacterized lipoprotein YmbA
MRTFKLAATAYLLGTLVLFQAGCLGPNKNPPTRFYVLSSLYSGETANDLVADLADVAIGVGPVRIPGKIDRPQIVTRSTPNEIRLADLAEWGDPLGVGFTRAMAENLALLLNTEKVSVFPWLKATRTDYQVTVDVVEFIGAPAETARLRAWWTIFGDDGRTELLKRYSRLEAEVSGDDIAAMVQAQSLLVERFSRQIAGALEALSQKNN